MNDGDALLAAILAHPDEDTPRLVYADWLQERGRGERAELIRLQCAIAAPFRHPCRGCGKPIRTDRVADGCGCNSPRGVNHGIVPVYVCTCAECDASESGSARGRPMDVCVLRREEDEMLNVWWSRFAGPAYYIIPYNARWRDYITFWRGFVESITCTAADWLQHGDAVLAAHPVTKVTLTSRPELDNFRTAPAIDGVMCRLSGRATEAEWPAGAALTSVARRLLEAEWPGVAFELPG